MADKSAETITNGYKPLQGKAALVTGGGRGIGKAVAMRLAQLGAEVGICGRNEQRLAETAATLRTIASRVHHQVADVSDAAQVHDLVSRTEEMLGPIAILVNNAGIGLFGPAHEKSEEEWDVVLNTNLKGVFLVSREVAPRMIRRKAGDIINISSLAGKNTFAGGGIYCASKWGLQGLTACMAEDLREHGIRVSVVCPGSVATEFSGKTKDAGRALAVEDVAHAVEMMVRQGAGSFVSEVQLRPLRKS